MPSVLKAATEIQKRKDKGKGKSTATEQANGNGEEVEKVKPRKDKNLLISSRGVTQRMRHLMNDLEALLPHTKKGEHLLSSELMQKDEGDEGEAGC
jgi:ribosome biogenesis protein BRX1